MSPIRFRCTSALPGPPPITGSVAPGLPRPNPASTLDSCGPLPVEEKGGPDAHPHEARRVPRGARIASLSVPSAETQGTTRRVTSGRRGWSRRTDVQG